MSKNIAISDEVYRKLKREKGNRSFSEVIDAKLETHGRLAEVSGQGVFDAETHDDVKAVIRGLSGGTVDRLDHETL